MPEDFDALAEILDDLREQAGLSAAELNLLPAAAASDMLEWDAAVFIEGLVAALETIALGVSDPARHAQAALRRIRRGGLYLSEDGASEGDGPHNDLLL